MSSLRRSHGGGRDFLQENKQNVSRMETNGRCLAAANARRVPLWRPVVLHYSEKLRPHGRNSQLRPRQQPAHEAPDLRSGLAQPYGFRNEPRRRMLPNQEVRREQERLQGGWEDQQKQRPAKKCCNGCHCHHGQGHQAETVSLHQGHQAEIGSSHQGHHAEMGSSHQGHHAEMASPHQGHQAEASAAYQGHQTVESDAIISKQGEGDQADRVSISSRLSRLSRRSQRIVTQNSQENTDVEAPLSARSTASAKTLKSRRSVSQESVRSNATIKSNITVASRSTTASKRSQVSRKSQMMEVMPPPTHLQDQKAPVEKTPPPVAYEGYTPLTSSERNAALQDAHFKYGKLVEEYNHLPVSEPTLRVRNRKIAIERQLDELDYAINMFDQPHLDMYYKK
ncbi:uncharacterized protein [Drosophila takahashii]|uniref:uncharacterized protein n=1 Tax=Drosophila takahashii TaxID=29030 RepID=UPI0038993BA3